MAKGKGKNASLVQCRRQRLGSYSNENAHIELDDTTRNGGVYIASMWERLPCSMSRDKLIHRGRPEDSALTLN